MDRTDCTVIHQETVDRVRDTMPDEDTLLELADAFKLFSDSTRLKILYALMEAEMCVCDISVLLGMTKSSVSHQLRVLKQSNLVKYRKAGRVIYYSLADDHVRTICQMGMAHVLEEDEEIAP
ncbi:MAG: winged helix-turn-helix transcriptional regulator [Oscillospiraceae bacterium]|nr:winged helix-turn-helix transcriptional regulator [Oscillospiraceae bacterium]